MTISPSWLVDYPPWPVIVTGPLRDAPRAGADEFFAWFLAARATRIGALCRVLPAVAHASSPAALVAIGDDVATRLREATYAAFSDDRAPSLTAFVGDLGLWLGERIIAAAPGLAWRLAVSHKKALGYQRPVIMGFAGLDPNYYVDVGFFVASWAELAARGRQAAPDFLAHIEASALADAAIKAG